VARGHARSRAVQKVTAKEASMLMTILLILVIMWLLGFSLHIGGSLIHALLVIALVVVVINLVSGRRVI
jgi:hypothetical protein